MFICTYVYAGILTRNSVHDSLPTDTTRKRLCDALAVASIVANSTGVDTSKNQVDYEVHNVTLY